MKTILWTVLIVMLFAGVAMAAIQGDPPQVGGFDWNNLWQMAILGALSTAILGKGKNGDFSFTKLADIDLKKMAMKAVVGLIIGIVASIKGVSLAESEVFLFGGDSLIVCSLAVFGVDYLGRTLFKGAWIGVKQLLGLVQRGDKADPPTPSEPTLEPPKLSS